MSINPSPETENKKVNTVTELVSDEQDYLAITQAAQEMDIPVSILVQRGLDQKEEVPYTYVDSQGKQQKGLLEPGAKYLKLDFPIVSKSSFWDRVQEIKNPAQT